MMQSWSLLVLASLAGGCATSSPAAPTDGPARDAAVGDVRVDRALADGSADTLVADATPADGPLAADLGADRGPGPNLGAGSWQVEQVSQTAGTISHSSSLALLASGTPVALWVEASPTDSFDEDIMSAVRGAGGWVAEQRTNDTKVQNAYPSLRSFGEVAHGTWNAYPSLDNDIFYVRYEGGSWTDRADLTSAFETAGLRHDYAPTLAVGPAGELAIAYVSKPALDNGNPTPGEPTEIRVLRLDAAGAAAGPPQAVIPPVGSDGCDAPAAVFDGNAKLHVVADCGPMSAEDIYYATDAAGSWSSTVVPGTGARDDYGAVLALDPDRATLHLAWMAFPPCSSGGGTCADVRYRRIRSGASFDPEIDVIAAGSESELEPAIAVDPFGRPIIALHRFNAENMSDVFVTWSDDGATFAPPRLVTPGTENRDDGHVTSLVIHPSSGMPQLIFNSTISSSPLNTEIMRAELVP